MPLAAISRRQMEQVDLALVEQIGFTLEMMVENASFLIATKAKEMLGEVKSKKITVLVGSGHNGADALATARRLSSWSADVTVLLSSQRQQLKPATNYQLELAEIFGVRVYDPGALIPDCQLIIDGLLGYNGLGKPRGDTAELINAAMKLRSPILAIDLPSGLDADTGKADQPAIRADVTLTLAYPKLGLTKDFAKNMVGELLLADVSIPPLIWQKLKLPPPDFSQSSVVTI